MSNIETHEIIVGEDGITFIHDDELNFLLDLGDTEIRRASHVEPCGKMWQADMSPVGGPILGPFKLRGQALRAERRWLERLLIK